MHKCINTFLKEPGLKEDGLKEHGLKEDGLKEHGLKQLRLNKMTLFDVNFSWTISWIINLEWRNFTCMNRMK